MKTLLALLCTFVVATSFAAWCRAAKPPAAAESVTITVGSRTSHQMLSGVGASWHSILWPTVGHGGSAFGGSPPVTARYTNLWDSMEKQAEWLGLKFIRAEMEWRQWQPERGQYTPNSPEMKILDRILSWAQRHDSDVMLQCMWIKAPWLAFPEYRDDPSALSNSAPADLDAFARGWVALLRELREKRGYQCIRWVNLVNEPNTGWWWWVPPNDGSRQHQKKKAKYLAQAMEKVRTALREANLPVRVMGPDFAGPPRFDKLADQPWFSKVDDVDFHSYCSCFDWENPKSLPVSRAYRLSNLFDTLGNYRKQTAAAGKGFYLTEFGTQTYGCAGTSPEPGKFKASLKDTELLIRAMNLGVDGLNHWSFVNRGDLDGQWQLVDTWNGFMKIWTDKAVPHRDAYYMLGLAIRHLPQRAKVLLSQVTGGQVQGMPRVWTVAVRSPKDSSLTILIVNGASRPWRARVVVEGLAKDLRCLRSTQGADPAKVLTYDTVKVRDGSAELALEPFSLTILTDQPLAADAPGRF